MSKTKWESKQSMGPADLARLLRRWADEIDEAKVEINGRSLELPQLVEVKRRFKEKEGQSKVALKISWPARRPLARERPVTIDDNNRPISLPKGFKELKKLMESSLDEIESAAVGRGSAAESLALFLATVGDFRSRSKPDWLEAAAELQAESELLKQAVETGHPNESLAAINRIRVLKKRYHDIFK